MVKISIQYEGDLGTTAVHGPSGTEMRTDAPKDNAGRGESFSPTDLLATALGTCALTTMAILARREGVPFDTGSAEVIKEMTPVPPRRVGVLTLTLRLPAGLSDAQRARLEDAGRRCPVALSLHPDVRVDMRFD